MTRAQLARLDGVVIGPPADEVALAVADALLPVPLPPALREFLTLFDGARIGDVEVFSTERITETTNSGAHTWQLPRDTLVIGTAGAGRALVMIAGRDGVDEVDDDPWDVRSMELAADTPLDLFLRHRGVPLRDRAAWSALPALGAALARARGSLARDVDALFEIGIASRAGTPLPSTLAGFRQVTGAQALQVLASVDFETFLINDRPSPPAPGPSAARAWEWACEELVLPALRDRIRAAPVPEVIETLGAPNSDIDVSVADTIRDLAWLALLGKARVDMAVFAGGKADAVSARLLAQVFLAGHVPVSLDAAI